MKNTPSGAVLTGAFLLSIRNKTETSAALLIETLKLFDKEDWVTFKNYVRMGSFL